VTDLLAVEQGSLFGDADALSWNLSDLKSMLRLIDLPGVTRPMLYFGMWRAMFAFHTVSRHTCFAAAALTHWNGDAGGHGPVQHQLCPHGQAQVLVCHTA